MAIAHLSTKIIGSGRSPIAAAAYRHRTDMHDEMQGVRVSYAAAEKDLAHEEVAIPVDAPAWLVDALATRTVSSGSEMLWTEVWRSEKRVDATYARDMDIALPKELTLDEQIALGREFVEAQFTSRGMVADWVIHNNDGNPHIHLMHTLRPLTEAGFGPKVTPVLDETGVAIRMPSGKQVYKKFIGGDKSELRAMRQAWGDTANRHLALAGHDVRIDMRSYDDQKIAITPTTHKGHIVARHYPDLYKDGVIIEDRLATLNKAEQVTFRKHVTSVETASQDIVRRPSVILDRVSSERSTFSEHDIARDIARSVTDPAKFAQVLDAIRSNPELVRLRPDVLDPATGEIVSRAVYSTRSLVRAEHEMAAAADTLKKRGGFGVSEKTIAAKIRAVETKNPDPTKHFKLSDEQVEAVKHVTADNGIAAIVGFAGAGKSTLMEAANYAWQAEGRRVFGAALAGKAAEGLEDSAAISSRTLASWQLAWKAERDLLQKGDVFVIDEAGMVSSKELSAVIKIVEAAGAKLVLVGDAMQLQPIDAGAAFRAITDRIGFAELSGIRRQKDVWAQEASRQFARGQVADALGAYNERGHIKFTADRVAATDAIVKDWAEARTKVIAKAAEAGKAVKGDELLILAATNKEVFALNQGVRQVMKAQGALSEAREFKTERGPREFAVGDRIIFLKNESFVERQMQKLGKQSVKNGMLGNVTSTKDGLLKVTLDNGRQVAFGAKTYANIDHGYAATVHKSQGVTVDQVFVMGTSNFDQHLSYVAMSRHRDTVTMYAPQTDFANFDKLAKTMGKSGAKTTTLDFANEEDYRKAAAEFVTRRGIDTVADILPAFAESIAQLKAKIDQQTKQLAALWQRAEVAIGFKREAAQAQAPVPTPTVQPSAPAAQADASSGMVQPPAIPAAQFERTVHQDAGRTIMRAVAARRAETLMQPTLITVFKDPAAAFGAIASHIIDKRPDPARLADAIKTDPSTFGAIKDKTAAGELQRHLRSLVVDFNRDFPDYLKQEERRRADMATAIPALSPAATATLAAIESARKAGGEDAAGQAMRHALADKPIAAEIKAASDAISKRFGWQAFGTKETPVIRKAAIERLPDDLKPNIEALAPAFAAVRAFGDAVHFAERREAAKRQAEPALHSIPTVAPPAAIAISSTSVAALVPIEPTAIGQKPQTRASIQVDEAVALITFLYDKMANETFRNALGTITAKHKDGAWNIALPENDTKFRDTVLKKIEGAAKAVEPRLEQLANGKQRAADFAASASKAEHVAVEERNGALAIKIKPNREAIDEMKAIGGNWVPKVGENGGYWKVEVQDKGHAAKIGQAIKTADAALAAQAKEKSPAADIQSPHPEITVSSKGAKIYVTTPNMSETNAILKAEGPGAMHWDAKEKAFAATVKTPDDLAAVTKRLDAVKGFYETQTILPPHEGRPGLAKPDDATMKVIMEATPAKYAQDPAVAKVIDTFKAKIDAALTPSEQKNLAAFQADRGAPIKSERLAGLSQDKLATAATLATGVTQLQAKGIDQQQAQGQSR